MIFFVKKNYTFSLSDCAVFSSIWATFKNPCTCLWYRLIVLEQVNISRMSLHRETVFGVYYFYRSSLFFRTCSVCVPVFIYWWQPISSRVFGQCWISQQISNRISLSRLHLIPHILSGNCSKLYRGSVPCFLQRSSQSFFEILFSCFSQGIQECIVCRIWIRN